ncbi:SRPBCC family protein [Jatrophihabitans fulvus]
MTDTEDRPADRIVLRYERFLPHPVEAVWSAVTDPAEIGAWWGHRPEIDLRVGGDYVSHHKSGDRVVDRVLRVEPPHLFAHTYWHHLNPDAVVTYELTAVSGGTLLVLTHEMSEHDLHVAARSVPGDLDVYELLSRTAGGWPRLLGKIAESLGAAADRRSG